MKKHLNNFPEHSISIESYNDLLNPCYDSILQFGDRLLVAKTNWKGGVEAAVYGFAEDPKEGLSSIECRLELLKISDEMESNILQKSKLRQDGLTLLKYVQKESSTFSIQRTDLIRMIEINECLKM